MNEAIVIALIASIPGMLAAYFGYKKSVDAGKTATQIAAQGVEAGAYDRARKLYEDGIRQLEDQVERLRRQVLDEQDISAKLRRRISDLEETVSRLRRQLTNSGIELSPEDGHVVGEYLNKEV